LPDRPAAAISRYKDAWVPVIGAHDLAPVALASGSEVVLETNTPIVLSVGAHYLPGFVTLRDTSFTDIAPTDDLEQAATDSNMKATAELFEASIESDTDIPSAYAVMIASPVNQKPDAPPSLAVRVAEIGDLQAGKARHFSARLPKVRLTGEKDWSLLVFSGGQEVRSTGMGAILTGYFDKVETFSLRNKIAERVAAGKDAPMKVFRQMPFSIPDDVKAKYHGKTITVLMTVSPEGHVVSVVPKGISDPALTEALTKAFASVLFLPQIKGGAAVSATAPVPIKL
jgi:hypothetical protein